MADLRQVRLDTLARMRARGLVPYAAKFTRSHLLNEAKHLAPESEAKVAGRVVL